MHADPRAGREGEEISRDRTGLGEGRDAFPAVCLNPVRAVVADDGPVGGRADVEGETGFQIRLVEAWKGHACVHGHEERVEIFAAIILVFVASDSGTGLGDARVEVDLYSVLSGAEKMSGKDEVSIRKRGWDCLAIQAGRVDSSIAVIEREIVGTGFGEGEVEDFPAGHCVRMRAQGQRELVMNAGYAAGAVFG